MLRLVGVNIYFYDAFVNYKKGSKNGVYRNGVWFFALGPYKSVPGDSLLYYLFNLLLV